jgi:hypothetical protein
VGSIPANSDAQNVPSFRRWRFEMKLSPFFLYYMQNMQNMSNWTPVAFELLQHRYDRNKGKCVLFYSGIGDEMIGLGFNNREQQKQFAEPDIINSELKSAFGDSRRPDEFPVLAVGLLQFGAIGQQEMRI